MITAIFELGTNRFDVTVDGENIIFLEESSGMAAPIEGLRLDYNGTILEFPDLKDDEDWRKKAIERFKEKIKSLPTESKRIDYVIDDLKKWGYIPLYKIRKGFRPTKIK